MNVENKPLINLRWISIVAAGLVCAITLLVLVGWCSGFLVLTAIFPGMIPMNPVVAIGFCLLGLAIELDVLNQDKPPANGRNWLITAMGCAVAGVAALRLAAYLGAWNAHIDSLLFSSELMRVPFAPNRMAPDTALGLLFGGMGVAGVVWRKAHTRQITGIVAIGLLLAGLYGVANYLFAIDGVVTRGVYIPTALHTAVVMLLLLVGLLALDEELPVIERLVGRSPGGMLMRRLLPPLIVLPLLLGWLRVFAEYHLRLSGMAASAATSVVMQIILLGALVWAAALVMDRFYEQRQQVLARLQTTQKELLAAKDAAEEAARVKSQFLANMSHEIRTPLHGVIAMMELLAETPLNERQLGYAQVAKASADALMAVITDILDFSKIEAGRMELEPMDFDLRVCTEDVAYMMLPAAARKQLELTCGIAPELPSLVHGDPVRLRQVLMNLIGNAIKFTDKGEVAVKVTMADNGAEKFLARFEVHDTGVGVPPEYAKKLFTAFTQAHRGAEKLYGGTGLGLAICKQVVELMGGRIVFESRPGIGSTFWFTVPLLRRKAVWLDAEALPETLRRQRVLLLVESRHQRDMLRDQLKYWNMEVEEAPTLEDCLRRLRDGAVDNPIHLLLVEHHQRDLNALQLSQEIHSRVDAVAPAIVALVRADMHLGADIQKQFGLSGVLSKPVRQSQLFDVLMRVISSDSRSAPSSAIGPATSGLRLPAAYHDLPVLVAEDNDINQFVIREVLTKLGLQCRIVSNGQQCVDALQKEKYALVLMDCLMPVMDGFQTARQIRLLESRGAVFSSVGPSRVAIIALTANASGLDRQNSLEAGMDAFLTKPLDRNRLVRLIMSLVPMPQEMHEAPSARDRDDAPCAQVEGTDKDPIDLARLSEYFARDSAAVERLLAQFIGQGAQQIAKLDECMTKRDWDAATRAAHAIKGTAACLFAEGLMQAAKDLELICRDGRDSDTVGGLWRKVQHEMSRCIQWLKTRQVASSQSNAADGA